MTIALSRGNVDGLGEAYAFGVVWSFAMKGLAVAVLRFKYPDAKRWKFPINLRLGRYELPLGLLATTAALFAMALINLFTKKIATVSGISFTLIFFSLFWLSERKYAREQERNQIQSNPYPDDPFREKTRERFRLEVRHDLSTASAETEACATLLHLDEPSNLQRLDAALAGQQPGDPPLIVAVVDHLDFSRIEADPDDPAGLPDKVNDLFSEVVFTAEAVGRRVRLIAFDGDDAAAVLPIAAANLKAEQA